MPAPKENSSKSQQSLYLVPGPSVQVMVHLRQAGTWDLGPFTAVLAPGHLLKQQNTKKL